MLFVVSSYFYRIEFQARGAPHVHALLWLEDEKGNRAPSLWNNESELESATEDDESLEKKIEDSNNELVSCSEDDAKCPTHASEESLEECEDCKILKDYVNTFQTHNCTFTCRKKKRILRISSKEGHGKNDPEQLPDLIVPVCRFKFPRFPLDKTTFCLPVTKETDEKEVLKMKMEAA